MDTLIVTGGAGFIGSHLVRALLTRADVRVVNLDLLTYAGNLDNLADHQHDPRHVFVRMDIADKAGVARLLERWQPCAILHLAAESHVDRSIDGPEAFAHTNVIGTLNLLTTVLRWWQRLDAPARERFRFLHVSTDEVYGSLGATGRFHETTAYAPNSPYSASKAASDHFVRAFHHTFGLPVLTTNCSNNYGPHQFPEKLLPLMILNAIAGRALPVYGDGLNVRDWLYVDDHVEALLTVLERGQVGRVYNIGGDCELANLDVVRAICRVVAEQVELAHAPDQLIQFVTDRPGHDRRYAIDASRIRDELGWTPTVSFDEGLRRTVRWYVANPEWVERIRDGRYRGERLGLSEAVTDPRPRLDP